MSLSVCLGTGLECNGNGDAENGFGAASTGDFDGSSTGSPSEC